MINTTLNIPFSNSTQTPRFMECVGCECSKKKEKCCKKYKKNGKHCGSCPKK